MPGNVPALLGMPDCERLQQLKIKLPTSEQEQRQVNEQTKQGKSKLNKDFKINLYLNHKINVEIDYFIAGPEMETDRLESAETAQIMQNNYD